MRDRGLSSIQRLVGVALLFMGFMNVLLSLTGGYDLDLFSAYTLLLGVILFIHSSVDTWHRWVVIGLTVALGLLFLIRGEVDIWSQRLMFYGMLIVVVVFIFWSGGAQKNGKKQDEGPGTGN